ncbi:immunoglobulin iota chain [Labeo rohita]|nr:immunoglobulin iota chain [Labeo rohita]
MKIIQLHIYLLMWSQVTESLTNLAVTLGADVNISCDLDIEEIYCDVFFIVSGLVKSYIDVTGRSKNDTSAQNSNNLQLPMEVLEMILLEVVLLKGDTAYMTLSLTCSCFRALVNTPQFRQKVHFTWLDRVSWVTMCSGSLVPPFALPGRNPPVYHISRVHANYGAYGTGFTY